MNIFKVSCAHWTAETQPHTHTEKLNIKKTSEYGGASMHWPHFILTTHFVMLHDGNSSRHIPILTTEVTAAVAEIRKYRAFYLCHWTPVENYFSFSHVKLECGLQN